MGRAFSVDVAFLRYRIARRLALFPMVRILACAFLFVGGTAAAVSGLLILDNWLASMLDFVLAVLFLGVGLGLWNLE